VNAVDHVERRESCRSESRYETEARQDMRSPLRRPRAVHRGMPRHPVHAVPAGRFGIHTQVLDALSNKSAEANMVEVVDGLGACSMKVSK